MSNSTTMDDNTKNKYYGNYEVNIKGIRGGGTILPSKPANREKTVESIGKTFSPFIANKNIPLEKTVYYSNPILTNGYLQPYPTTEKLSKQVVSDYYYPSQKFDPVVNTNAFIFPPPLIEPITKPNIQTIENFQNTTQTLAPTIDDEIVLLTILTVLIIIYFSKYK